MTPAATGETNEWWRKRSRAKMLERCTSITGRPTARIASCRASEVWVKAPGLMTMPLAAGGRLVDPVDQLALVVGLAEVDRKAQPFAGVAAGVLDVVEAAAAVDRRLALAEQVEIGTVEDEDRDRHRSDASTESAAAEGPRLRWRRL